MKHFSSVDLDYSDVKSYFRKLLIIFAYLPFSVKNNMWFTDLSYHILHTIYKLYYAAGSESVSKNGISGVFWSVCWKAHENYDPAVRCQENTVLLHLRHCWSRQTGISWPEKGKDTFQLALDSYAKRKVFNQCKHFSCSGCLCIRWQVLSPWNICLFLYQRKCSYSFIVVRFRHP